MNLISDAQIFAYVEAHIGGFHQQRLDSLNKLTLHQLLSRKNPYLFKSKNLAVAADLIRTLLDAHLSSQEEEMFGEFLEGLAVYVAETAYGGRKSSTTGIDLELEKDGVRYLVSIKSGPNWGNSSQVTKMRDNFRTATRTIRQGNRAANVVAINGCCYGRHTKPDKGDYLKYCGQEFWELISADPEIYTRIIEPLGHQAKERNDAFNRDYGTVINRLTAQFTANFCADSGAIDWPKLVAFSSAKGRAPRLR